MLLLTGMLPSMPAQQLNSTPIVASFAYSNHATGIFTNAGLRHTAKRYFRILVLHTGTHVVLRRAYRRWFKWSSS